MRTAVVISFDSLHLGYLAPYGNDWVETPHLNQLAAAGIVFDQHFADRLEKAQLGLSWWQTTPNDGSGPSSLHGDQLADRLRSLGVRSRLIIEQTTGEDARPVSGWDQIIPVMIEDREWAEDRDFPFARLIARAIEEWQTNGPRSEQNDKAEQKDQPHLFWIQSRGVPSPWVPPPEISDLYFSEFDLVEDEVTTPDSRPLGVREMQRLAALEEAEALDELDDLEDAESNRGGMDEESDIGWLEYEQEESTGALTADGDASQTLPDPDQISETGEESNEKESEAELALRYGRALYAAYVTFLDLWMGKLLTAVRNSVPEGELLLIVTAASGQSLGEHAPLGEEPAFLHEERIHLPLIVLGGAADQRATRRSALTTPADIPATLSDWFGGANRFGAGQSLLPVPAGTESDLRTFCLIEQSGLGRAVRTADAFLTESHELWNAAPRESRKSASASVRIQMESEREAEAAAEGNIAAVHRRQLYIKPHDRFEFANIIDQEIDIAEELGQHLSARDGVQTPPA